jgi:protein ImuB
MACVDLPSLPLQLLLLQHPEWREHPVAVVDRDKPQGVILWVNDRAGALRILPGMRYAAGLSLARELRAGVVPAPEIARRVSAIAEVLRRFTPDVEPSADEPGVFWLDASGLSRLFPSLREWADRLRAALEEIGFQSAVAVGFSRFGTYAAAKAGAGAAATESRAAASTAASTASATAGSTSATTSSRVVVFTSAAEERSRVRRVRITELAIDPSLRDVLLRLGITTLGAFLDLPAAGVLKRFGADVHRFHRLARGELWAPVESRPPAVPLEGTVFLDHPESDRDRLMGVIQELIDSLLASLAERNEALAALAVHFAFDRGGGTTERLRPASPTLASRQILDLIRLRLEAITLPSGISDVRIRVEGVAATRKQLDLFEEKPRRDLEAASRAFARLRAELGDQAVMSACIQEGHLPEARFAWRPMAALSTPRPRNVKLRPLVRRIFSRPIALPLRGRHEPDGWLVSGAEHGHVEEAIGPHIVSGGWWSKDVHREYHFVRTRKGRWLWIYYDRRRRGWFLHGEVE